MTDMERVVFWGVILLLCLVSLTAIRELGRLVKKVYRHLTDGWKWAPYLPYITGGVEKEKHTAIGMKEERSFHSIRRRIFPRSRRST